MRPECALDRAWRHALPAATQKMCLPQPATMRHRSRVLTACRHRSAELKWGAGGVQGQVWLALAPPAALVASTWADELILSETNTSSYLIGLGLAGGLTTFDNPVKGARPRSFPAVTCAGCVCPVYRP